MLQNVYNIDGSATCVHVQKLLKRFYEYISPFTTEPQAIFLLLENDNLGIIN